VARSTSGGIAARYLHGGGQCTRPRAPWSVLSTLLNMTLGCAFYMPSRALERMWSETCYARTVACCA